MSKPSLGEERGREGGRGKEEGCGDGEQRERKGETRRALFLLPSERTARRASHFFLLLAMLSFRSFLSADKRALSNRLRKSKVGFRKPGEEFGQLAFSLGQLTLQLGEIR